MRGESVFPEIIHEMPSALCLCVYLSLPVSVCTVSSSTGAVPPFTFTNTFCCGPVQNPTSAQKTFDSTFE